MVRRTRSITRAFQATSASLNHHNTLVTSTAPAQSLFLSPQPVTELEFEFDPNAYEDSDSELDPTYTDNDDYHSSIPSTPTPITGSGQRGTGLYLFLIFIYIVTCFFRFADLFTYVVTLSLNLTLNNSITYNPTRNSVVSSSQVAIASVSALSRLNTSPPQIPAHAEIASKNMRSEISSSMRSKIRALRHIAQWSYRCISQNTGISLSTVYRIAHPPSTPVHRAHDRRRPVILTPQLRSKLIDLATSTAANRRKPLAEIAFMAGVQANNRTLRRSFAQEGDHRRVARKKPFLKPQHKTVRIPSSSFLCSFFFSLPCLFILFYFFLSHLHSDIP